MAHFDNLSFTQSWILLRYSKLVPNSNDDKGEWKVLDGHKLGTPLTLSITVTNFLLIKHENDIEVAIEEFINLWTLKSNMRGIYKGDSLLVMLKMKDSVKKFRVQFVCSKSKTAEENCLQCVRELGKFFEINPYEQTETEAQTVNGTSAKNTKNAQSLDSYSVNDLTKVLLSKNEHKLPLFYRQFSENELFGDANGDQYLQEFIVCSLLDPSFPNFVHKVEKLLQDLLKNL